MDFRHSKSLFGIFFFLFLLVFQGCSKARFSADAGAESLSSVGGSGDDGSCRANPTTTNKIIKVLFVVDTSGSNVIQNKTDINKKWRAATIKNFMQQYSGKTNFYYGLITFQDATAQGQILVNGAPSFSNDLEMVENGYARFLATPDNGSTPYKAALLMAKNIISADFAAHATQNASYVMVMVSDGQAMDYKSPEQVIPDAEAIMAVAPGQVSLNSVYYYSTALDDSQTLYLRNISKVGGGSFIIANSNQVLSINDVIQLPPAGCQ